MVRYARISSIGGSRKEKTDQTKVTNTVTHNQKKFNVQTLFILYIGTHGVWFNERVYFRIRMGCETAVCTARLVRLCNNKKKNPMTTTNETEIIYETHTGELQLNTRRNTN